MIERTLLKVLEARIDYKKAPSFLPGASR